MLRTSRGFVYVLLLTLYYTSRSHQQTPTLADAGSDSVDNLARIVVSLYMIVVTIVLLNLLIAIINESYTRIRENEAWESLRNKPLLILDMDALLPAWMKRRVYRECTGCTSPDPDDFGKRWLYVITVSMCTYAQVLGADAFRFMQTDRETITEATSV